MLCYWFGGPHFENHCAGAGNELVFSASIWGPEWWVSVVSCQRQVPGFCTSSDLGLSPSRKSQGQHISVDLSSPNRTCAMVAVLWTLWIRGQFVVWWRTVSIDYMSNVAWEWAPRSNARAHVHARTHTHKHPTSIRKKVLTISRHFISFPFILYL